MELYVLDSISTLSESDLDPITILLEDYQICSPVCLSFGISLASVALVHSACQIGANHIELAYGFSQSSKILEGMLARLLATILVFGKSSS